jgi:hypothetical protein
MTARCREGHDSSELDYCSVCGVPMPLGSQTGTPTAAGASGACPSCGEPRADPDARFCEVCRYDFIAKMLGPPPQARAAAPTPGSGSPSGASTGMAWEFVVTIDASLDTEPDAAAPCPAGEPEHVFDFDGAEMLVGRRDDRRDIRPEIAVGDPGSSRRHAKFVRNADGSVALQDLASMNGTSVNGATVTAGSRQTLKAGDEVTLGRWTRIKLRRKA